MKKILAVDDTDIILELLKQHLEKEGYNVCTSNTAGKAMQMIEDDDFDLVLLDIVMPEKSGIDVLKFIKKNNRNKATPVIMLSAREDMNSIRECLVNGAIDYMTKPFNIVSVKQRIADVFNGAL